MISIHSSLFAPSFLQEMCSDFNNSRRWIFWVEKQLKGAFGSPHTPGIFCVSEQTEWTVLTQPKAPCCSWNVFERSKQVKSQRRRRRRKEGLVTFLCVGCFPHVWVYASIGFHSTVTEMVTGGNISIHESPDQRSRSGLGLALTWMKLQDCPFWFHPPSIPQEADQCSNNPNDLILFVLFILQRTGLRMTEGNQNLIWFERTSQMAFWSSCFAAFH